MKIQDLYDKIALFEEKISPSVREQSSCKMGCAKCCYTDISIFEVEAKNLRSWFTSLTDEKKLELKSYWKEPSRQTRSFSGEDVSSCVFLHNEMCTVYEARPLICRTQGHALNFREGAESYVDICPLNEDMLESIQSSEVMNLDLLNSILSGLEKLDSGNQERKRIRLKDLKDELWTLSEKR